MTLSGGMKSDSLHTLQVWRMDAKDRDDTLFPFIHPSCFLSNPLINLSLISQRSGVQPGKAGVTGQRVSQQQQVITLLHPSAPLSSLTFTDITIHLLYCIRGTGTVTCVTRDLLNFPFASVSKHFKLGPTTRLLGSESHHLPPFCVSSPLMGCSQACPRTENSILASWHGSRPETSAHGLNESIICHTWARPAGALGELWWGGGP